MAASLRVPACRAARHQLAVALVAVIARQGRWQPAPPTRRHPPAAGQPRKLAALQGRRDGTTRDEPFAWQSREFLRKLCVGKVRPGALGGVRLLLPPHLLAVCLLRPASGQPLPQASSLPTAQQRTALPC